MNWNHKFKIEDVYSGFSVVDDLMLYYSSKFDLVVRDRKTGEYVVGTSFQWGYNYQVFSEKIYIGCENEIKVFKIFENKLTTLCKTKSQQIQALSEELFIGVSYFRKENIHETILLNRNCVCKWKIRCKKSMRNFFPDYLLFSDIRGKEFGVVHLESGDVVWENKTDDKIYSEPLLYKDDLILPFKSRLLCFHVDSGTLQWELEETTYHYNLDKTTGLLYSLAGKKYEVIDAESGHRAIQKELDANIHISPTMTTLAGGYLFFSGLKMEGSIPIIGAVDVDRAELAFIQEVELEGERSFRTRLQKPVVAGDRLYVRDPFKKLHVFERSDS